MSTRHVRRAREPGSLIKHLRGDYSLARSYWLHTVLLGFGVSLLAGWAFHRIGERYAMRHVALAVLAFQPVALLIWLWAVIGAWMSALKHLFGGGSKLWAIAAMLSLAAGVFGMLRELAAMRPAVQEYWEVMNGKQPGGGFSVTLTDDGRIVDFKGGIDEGAAAKLDQVIAAAPNVTTVRLDSPGGWLREGRRMAQVVQRYRLHTRVDKECFSSCTLVLLAGLDRTTSETALVGFHRGRSIGESSRAAPRPSADEAELYRQAGLDKGFVSRILATPNDQIWVPTRRQLLDAQVLTR